MLEIQIFAVTPIVIYAGPACMLALPQLGPRTPRTWPAGFWSVPPMEAPGWSLGAKGAEVAVFLLSLRLGCLTVAAYLQLPQCVPSTAPDPSPRPSSPRQPQVLGGQGLLSLHGHGRQGWGAGDSSPGELSQHLCSWAGTLALCRTTRPKCSSPAWTLTGSSSHVQSSIRNYQFHLPQHTSLPPSVSSSSLSTQGSSGNPKRHPESFLRAPNLSHTRVHGESLAFATAVPQGLQPPCLFPGCPQPTPPHPGRSLKTTLHVLSCLRPLSGIPVESDSCPVM